MALLAGTTASSFVALGPWNTVLNFAIACAKAGLVAAIFMQLRGASALVRLAEEIAMLDVMSKFLLMGMSLEQVVLRSTWNPAKEIQLDELGHLSVGAPADIAVLRVDRGKFGFVDQSSLVVEGTQRLGCEATFGDGKVLYDANGITMPRYK